MASLLAAAVRGGRNIQQLEIFQPSRRLRDAWPSYNTQALRLEFI